MKVLKIKNLTKFFDEQIVLDNVNLVLNKKEVVSILGKSGCGKTTLLRIISNLDIYDFGSIEKNGRSSIVFQSFNLWLHKTVLENIIEGLIIVKKMSKKKAILIGKSLLEKVSLLNKCNSYPFALSNGEQQRVALLRAVAMKPEIYLLDEITSALDVDSIKSIVGIIKDQVEKGKSFIIVTHDLKFAKNISDKIYIMNKGKLKLL